MSHFWLFLSTFSEHVIFSENDNLNSGLKKLFSNKNIDFQRASTYSEALKEGRGENLTPLLKEIWNLNPCTRDSFNSSQNGEIFGDTFVGNFENGALVIPPAGENSLDCMFIDSLYAPQGPQASLAIDPVVAGVSATGNLQKSRSNKL